MTDTCPICEGRGSVAVEETVTKHYTTYVLPNGRAGWPADGAVPVRHSYEGTVTRVHRCDACGGTGHTLSTATTAARVA